MQQKPQGGAPPIATSRLYRLAHSEADGQFTQVGRAYLSLEEAARGSVTQNAARKEHGLPPVTHLAVYSQSEIVPLPDAPWARAGS
jgi:hypothetical protein